MPNFRSSPDEPARQAMPHSIPQEGELKQDRRDLASSSSPASAVNQRPEIEELPRGVADFATKGSANASSQTSVNSHTDLKAAPSDTIGKASFAGDPHPSVSLDALLDQAEKALASLDQPDREQAKPVELRPFHLTELAEPQRLEASDILSLGASAEVQLRVELGKAYLSPEDASQLSKGDVVSLEQWSGSLVDIYAGERLIARGEVLTLDGNFCVRVAELVTSSSAASA